jgi:anthranilate/para-aminobenzoate synthase component I
MASTSARATHSTGPSLTTISAKAGSHAMVSPLIARLVEVAPDPRRIAEALGDRPGTVLLWSASGGGPSYVACDPSRSVRGLDPERDLALDPSCGELLTFPRWIGLMPYEARRALERPGRTAGADARPAPHVSEPVWWRYGAVARITDHVLVAGDEPDAVRRLCSLLRGSRFVSDHQPAQLEPLIDDDPPKAHIGRVERALELIAQGEIYQVNLARRLRFAASGSALSLLRLLGGARPPFGAAFAVDGIDVVSTSPELFLALDPDGRVLTSPIKGTRPRGRDATEDAALARELDCDPKERAELTMVLDVERNDLGRVAVPGSLRLIEPPRVHAHSTVHHRAATLSARLRPGVSRAALLEAMLPSGSVTGAPKIRSMEVIAELEASRRGLYTGALGFIRHDGGLRLAMAIRTLTVQGGEGHYFVGGGIVADSKPDRELEETRWKAVQLVPRRSPVP